MSSRSDRSWGGLVSAPDGLGERGSKLWESLASGDHVRDALVLEAARLADRLDELDNIIQGKGVLELMRFRVLDGSGPDDVDYELWRYNVEVKFDNVLAEARQQATTFANVLSKLGLSASDAVKPANDSSVTASADDMLAARRAKRAAGK